MRVCQLINCSPVFLSFLNYKLWHDLLGNQYPLEKAQYLCEPGSFIKPNIITCILIFAFINVRQLSIEIPIHDQNQFCFNRTWISHWNCGDKKKDTLFVFLSFLFFFLTRHRLECRQLVLSFSLYSFLKKIASPDR